MAGSPASNLGLEIAALYKAIRSKDLEGILFYVEAVSASISRMTALVFIPVSAMLMIVFFDNLVGIDRLNKFGSIALFIISMGISAGVFFLYVKWLEKLLTKFLSFLFLR